MLREMFCGYAVNTLQKQYDDPLDLRINKYRRCRPYHIHDLRQVNEYGEMKRSPHPLQLSPPSPPSTSSVFTAKQQSSISPSPPEFSPSLPLIHADALSLPSILNQSMVEPDTTFRSQILRYVQPTPYQSITTPNSQISDQHIVYNYNSHKSLPSPPSPNSNILLNDKSIRNVNYDNNEHINYYNDNYNCKRNNESKKNYYNCVTGKFMSNSNNNHNNNNNNNNNNNHNNNNNDNNNKHENDDSNNDDKNNFNITNNNNVNIVDRNDITDSNRLSIDRTMLPSTSAVYLNQERGNCSLSNLSLKSSNNVKSFNNRPFKAYPAKLLKTLPFDAEADPDYAEFRKSILDTLMEKCNYPRSNPKMSRAKQPLLSATLTSHVNVNVNNEKNDATNVQNVSMTIDANNIHQNSNSIDGNVDNNNNNNKQNSNNDDNNNFNLNNNNNYEDATGTSFSDDNTNNINRNPSTETNSVAGDQKTNNPDRTNKQNVIVKDATYFQRRTKNNAAAKKSRDLRRRKEDELAIRTTYLEHKVTELSLYIQTKELEIRVLSERLAKYEQIRN